MLHDPQSERRFPKSRSGFTLIEFIVVITILGILATLIVPRFIGRVGSAKQAVAKTNMKTLEQKVVEFQTDCGRYPTEQEGLGARLQPPSDVASKWHGPYVDPKDILDPWARNSSTATPASGMRISTWARSARTAPRAARTRTRTSGISLCNAGRGLRSAEQAQGPAFVAGPARPGCVPRFAIRIPRFRWWKCWSCWWCWSWLPA